MMLSSGNDIKNFSLLYIHVYREWTKVFTNFQFKLTFMFGCRRNSLKSS